MHLIIKITSNALARVAVPGNCRPNGRAATQAIAARAASISQTAQAAAIAGQIRAGHFDAAAAQQQPPFLCW